MKTATAKTKIKSGDELRDDFAAALRRAKLLGESLSTGTELQREQIDALEKELFYLRSSWGDPEIDRLVNHLETCRRMRNVQELGSFSIQIKNFVQRAWERMVAV